MRIRREYRTNFVLRLLVLLGATLAGPGDAACPTSACAGESSAESPLSKPAFAAAPEELLAFAEECDYDLGDADIEILLDEGRYRLDPDGKMTTIARVVYRCLTRQAFERSGVVSAAWSPWYQERPKIRARVVTPDGQVHALDEGTIEEIQIPALQPNVFTDAKLLRAPLPALSVGCVVETEVVVGEHRPFSSSGGSGSFQFGTLLAPSRLIRFVLEVPASTPLDYRVLRSDVAPVVKRDGDLRVITLSSGPAAALLEQLEQHLPSHLAPFPMFIFSTAKSWNDVAKEYAAIVQQQLAGNELQEVVRDVLGPSPSRETDEIAERLLEFINQRIRFTAVAFGSGAIVPRTPRETLYRHYGDCKDLATLYVGLLRAAGVEADVALLNTGPGMDTIPDLPCLSGFDHAIVCIRGDTPIWIDPTSRYRPFGELPAGTQGRFALVVNDKTTELTRIPQARAAENSIVEARVITFSDMAPAKVASVTTSGGVFAPAGRASFASADQEQRRGWLRQQGLELFGTDKLIAFSCSDPADLKSPFRVKTEYDETSLALVEHPDAYVLVPLHEAFDRLPFDLTGLPDCSRVASSEDEADSQERRERPLSLPFPFRHELEYRIVPAPGFKPVELPDDQEITLGPACLSVTYLENDDHSITVRILFDSGRGDFTAEAVRKSRRKIQSLGEENGYRAWRATIHFEQTAGKHLESGRFREAVAAYHELLREHPDEAVRHTQYAEAVLLLGLGDLARTHARQAVELAPAESYTQYMLGYVLAHNRIGQFQAPGFDRAGGVAAYRKTLEIEPDNRGVRWELGTLLECDERGVRYGNRDFTEAAIAEFATVHEEYKDENLLDSLVSAMCALGKIEEARKVLEKAEASAIRDLLLLAVIAANEGADACMQRAAAMRPAGMQRQLLLQQVLGSLGYLREYEAAAELAGRLAANSLQKDVWRRYAEEFGGLTRYDREKDDREGPTGLVRLVMANALVHGTASSRLKRFFVNVPEETGAAFDCRLPFWMEHLRRVALDAGYPSDRVADIVMEFDYEETEVDMDCHRVFVKHRTAPVLCWTAIVLRDECGLRLYQPGDQNSELGQHALRLLDEGREDDARCWLSWAYEQQRQDVNWLGSLLDPFEGTPFVRLWASGNKEKSDLQLAAAALAVRCDAPEEPIAILDASRDGLSGRKRLQVDRALAAGYAKSGNGQELATLAASMCKQYPKAAEPVACRLRALGQLGDIRALEEFVDQHAEDEEMLRSWKRVVLADATTATGDTGRAGKHLSELRQRDDLPALLLCRIAWLSLFQDPVPDETLALAADVLTTAQTLQTEERSEAERAAYSVYTLALVEAGQLSEALQALCSVPAVDAESRPNNLDKLVLGRIAEQCGLREHAKRLYREIEQDETRMVNSVFDLAQNRLKKLGGEGEE